MIRNRKIPMQDYVHADENRKVLAEDTLSNPKTSEADAIRKTKADQVDFGERRSSCMLNVGDR
jgi:hypothetical protein